MNVADQNSPSAILDAVNNGWGVETDVRIRGSSIVVSHDPPGGSLQTLSDLIEGIERACQRTQIALNIKEDGLACHIQELFATHPMQGYFCFDMSLPEMLKFIKRGLPVFTRQSEFEHSPLLLEMARGVWMDMFVSDWIQPEHIAVHLDAGFQVALVSPELHKRDYLPFWESLRASGLHQSPGLMLCTDHPFEAEKFFNGSRSPCMEA